MSNFLYVYADTPQEWNCSAHNCAFPAKYINKTPGNHAEIMHMDEFRQNTEKVQEVCNTSDLIIVERNFFGDIIVLTTLYRLRNRNIAAIFDDAYYLMERNNVSYSFWKESKIKAKNNETGEIMTLDIVPKILDQFKYGLKQVKGIILPSEMLCRDWQKTNAVYRTWNYIDEDRYKVHSSLLPHNDIWIGWCGSMSHYESFVESGILPALEYVVKKHSNVKIMIGGDPRVYNLLSGIPNNRKIFFNYVPEKDYASLISTMDIGLAPLATPFDKRRSWIKVLEYMYLKIPWIATDFPTYSELKEFGTVVKNGEESWKNALDDAVLNFDRKKQLANTKAYDFSLTKTWGKNIGKYLKMLQKIMDSEYVW